MYKDNILKEKLKLRLFIFHIFPIKYYKIHLLTSLVRRFKSSPVNAIFCQALAGSPLRPQRLAQLDKEQEEQLKPPFGATSEPREVRRAKINGDHLSTRNVAYLHLWYIIGGDVSSERRSLHLHPQTHDRRRAVSGHCWYHAHLSLDRRTAN